MMSIMMKGVVITRDMIERYDYFKRKYKTAVLTSLKIEEKSNGDINKHRVIIITFQAEKDILTVEKQYTTKKELFFKNSLDEEFVLRFQEKSSIPLRVVDATRNNQTYPKPRGDQK